MQVLGARCAHVLALSAASAPRSSRSVSCPRSPRRRRLVGLEAAERAFDLARRSTTRGLLEHDAQAWLAAAFGRDPKTRPLDLSGFA